MASLATPKAPKGYELVQLPTHGGQAAGAYSQLAGALPNWLAMASGSPGAFEAMEAPVKSFYEQKLAPGIAQRYAGAGIGASSGMQNALAAGAAGLSENLAARRAQLMQQSMQNVLNLGNVLLSRPDINYDLMEKEPSGWQKALGIGLPIAGTVLGGAAGAYFGNPMLGAELGGKLGSYAGQAFL